MEKDFFKKVYEFNATAKGRRKKLTTLLLSSPGEAAMMTIEEIAVAVGATAGMVSRCVRCMGFDSYADMKGLLRKALLKTLPPSGRMKALSTSSCMESLAQDAQNLASIAKLNTEKSFQQGAELLARAPAVHIYGLRSSYPLAYFLSLCLEQVRGQIHLMGAESGRLVEEIKRLCPNDLLLIVAFPRYLKNSLHMVREARHAKCRILAITDSPSSPVGYHADVVLTTHYEGVSFFNAPAAQFALGAALITQTAQALGEQSRQELERLSLLQKRWGIMADDNEAWEEGEEKEK